MQRGLFNKIITSAKIKIIILALVILLPIFYAVQMVVNDVDSTTELVLSNIRIVTNNILIQQTEIFNEAHVLLEIIAQLPEVLNHKNNTEACSKKLIDIYENSLSKLYFSQVSVVTVDGFTYCAGRKLDKPLDRREGFPEFWQAMEERRFVVSPTYRIGKASGKPSINTAYPIIQDNKLLGVVFLGVLISKFNNIINDQNIPDFVSFYIIDNTGTIFLEKNQFDESTIDANISSIIPNIMQKLVNPRGVIEILTADGERKYVVYDRYSGAITSVAIFSESDVLWSVIYRQESLLYVIALFSLISSIISVVFGVFQKYYFNKDLGNVVNMVNKIADGELAVNIPNYSHIPDFTRLFELLRHMCAVLTDKDDKIKNAMNKLQSSNQELEQFAYIASHDLQEPMRRIEFFSSMIKEMVPDVIDPSLNEYITRLEKAAKRMRLLIVDLLKLSRVNSNKDSFVIHSLEQIACTITSELNQLIKETNTIVNLSNLPAIPVNKVLMEGVFRNLITNSIKFRREAPPIINITAEKVLEDMKITGYNISIQDNGVGFSMEYATKIFEAFYRIGVNNTEGTGMGLAIVKKSIDRHNGTINVVSVPNEGTTFTIFLPITQEEK